MFVPDINWKSYAGQTPFRFWCQTVLPLVYEESLSYYELLCKVVNYLNNLLKDLNGVADNVLELNKGYEQLVNYINNYFENLNVQEEINNKLDEMAEDGTLTNLFSSYMLKKFDTAEEMAADTTLVLGAYCQTLGFHSTGDKRGCKYRITDSVDLAPASIKLDNGYYAFPIENDFKTGYVYWDSEHNVDGIEGILEFALNNYENVTITEDEYEITRTIEVNKNGETLKTINLYIDDKADIDVTINYEEDSTNTEIEHIAIGFYIENCSLKINGGQFTYTALDSSDQKVKLWYQRNSKCSLFYIYLCPYVDIKNININSLYCGRGVNIVSCDDIKINNIYIDGKGTYTDADWHNFAGVTVGNYFVSFSATNCNIKNIRNQSTESDKFCYGIATGFTSYQIETPLCGRFYVANCKFENCYWEGADTHGSELSTITNCYFHNCYRFAGIFHDGRVKWTTNGGIAIFSNNYCENDFNYDGTADFFETGSIFASATSNGFQYDMFLVQNCYIKRRASQTCTHHFQNVTYQNCVLDFCNSNNYFITAAYADITFDNVKFRNMKKQNGCVTVYHSNLHVKNCSYEVDDVLNSSNYTCIEHDAYTTIDWDKEGGIYSPRTNGFAGLMQMSTRMTKMGELINVNNGNNQNVTGITNYAGTGNAVGYFLNGFRYNDQGVETPTITADITPYVVPLTNHFTITPDLNEDNDEVEVSALTKLNSILISKDMNVTIQVRESDGETIVENTPYRDIVNNIKSNYEVAESSDHKFNNFQTIDVYFCRPFPAIAAGRKYYLVIATSEKKTLTFDS